MTFDMTVDRIVNCLNFSAPVDPTVPITSLNPISNDWFIGQKSPETQKTSAGQKLRVLMYFNLDVDDFLFAKTMLGISNSLAFNRESERPIQIQITSSYPMPQMDAKERLTELIEDHKPHIVQFMGTGFASGSGISTKDLVSIFNSVIAKSVECVVFQDGDRSETARALLEQTAVETVVAPKFKLANMRNVKFAELFYHFVGKGMKFAEAAEQAAWETKALYNNQHDKYTEMRNLGAPEVPVLSSLSSSTRESDNLFY